MIFNFRRDWETRRHRVTRSLGIA